MTIFRRPTWKFRLPRRFRRDESGAAAVEFGFVAMPFFALMFAIIETSMSFFTSQILETAVSDASRLLMTGQAQAASMTQQQFKAKVCAPLPAFFDCQNTVQIDVRTYSSYSGSDMSRPIVNGQVNWGGSPVYQPGGPSEIVVVRAVYPMTTYTNFYGISLANTSDGKMLLMASSAFRNEPFTGATP